MKKAIKYLRYSSDGQSQHSIERQEIITSGWAAQQSVSIVDTFIDEGYSARTFDRPDMKMLMAFIKKNYRHIDYLIVAELTRFSREAGDAINMVKQIQHQYGIRIVSASRSSIYDCYDSSSFFMMGLEFLLGNSENIKRTNDINGGIYTAKTDGRWIQGGAAPYGFAKDGTGKERRLVVKEAEAAVIRFIYAAYLSNTPFYIIAQDARKMGLKRNGNSAVQEILQNPIYMGYQYVKAWKDHPGGLFPLKNHSPIIDTATWYKVQEKFSQKNKPRVTITDSFPLRQVLKCHCGLPLTGAPSRGKSGKYFNYYKCQKSGHNSINANKAHAQLEEIMQLLSIPDRLLAPIKNTSEKLLEERNKESAVILQSKKQDLFATNAKLESIEEKFIANQLNFESYDKWHRTLSNERMQLKSSIHQLEQDSNHVYFLLQKNIGRLSDLRYIYTSSSTVQKQELLRQVFDNGLYYRQQAYRTPYIMPVFSHNLLTLKEKSLLFLDGDQRKSGDVEASGLLSNSFLDFLSFLDSLRVA